jgi:predicted nucleotidyltransferase
LSADPRIVGVAAAGSYARDALDEHSDLDLVIAVEDAARDALLAERMALARALAPLLVAFTGEHVGAPHLLICLYGPPLLHVDLKLVTVGDAARRVDECAVLFDRDGRLARSLASRAPAYPQPDLQWFEDRMWPWVHYIAGKVARGELFEAIDGLGFIRARVLGPLILAEQGAQPNGVRRIETAAPDRVAALRETLPAHDPDSCLRALRAVVALYRALRERAAGPALVRHPDAERESLAFLAAVEEDR